tara:strand:+ start:7985 stop:8410 length:426 start_codon:yes stop_codon:yes gene_type:complete
MITPDKFGKILNKLPKEKTELTKVELSFSSDLKKSLNSLTGLMKKGTSLNNKMEGIQDRLYKLADTLRNEGNRAGKMMEEIYNITDNGKKLLSNVEKAAKELGVKPSEIEGYAAFKDLRGQGYSIGKRLQNSLIDTEKWTR